MELDLNGEFPEDDIRNLHKDKNYHGLDTQIVRYPARAGTYLFVSIDQYYFESKGK